MKVIVDQDLIEEIKSLDEKQKEIAQQKADILSQVMGKNSPEPELVVCAQKDDGGWDRLTITDNAATILEGFWKPMRVDRFSTKIESLKNKPKELA